MIETEIITDICLKVIEPLQNNLNGLVERLTLKEDLQTFIESIEAKLQYQISSCLDQFKKELHTRDTEISRLENEIVALKDTQINQENKIVTILQWLGELENDTLINDEESSIAPPPGYS